MTLANLLRLGARFGATIRYVWPETSEKHDMSIGPDAPPIFDPAFQAAHIDMVAVRDRSVFAGRTDIDLVASRVSAERFAIRLAEGERFVCMAGLVPLRFMDEAPTEAIDAFRKAAASIRFAAPIEAALAAAEETLHGLGRTRMALHLRRGDVIAADPWRHRAWSTKFVPDEFYAQKLSEPGVSAVVFSDTPAAAERMCRAFPNARRLEDLVPMDALSTLQRDLVELLLMSRCSEIVAPVLSGFSASAANYGGVTVSGLPLALEPARRREAYDGVLDRAVAGPDRFLNSGDFAQSLVYAYKHAIGTGRHRPLYARTLASIDAGAPEALLLPVGMMLALACGDTGIALALHARAGAHPDLWEADRRLCAGLACIARHHAGETEQATRDFLQLHFARSSPDDVPDVLAGYFLAREPALRSLFLLDPTSLHHLTRGDEPPVPVVFPIDDCALGADANRQVPLWINVGDWPEMFDRPGLPEKVAAKPTLAAKIRGLPPAIVEAERLFHATGTALPDDPGSLAALSLLSVALLQAGRYRRALPLMFHCRNSAPANPIYLKRLANHFMVMKNPEKALTNLERALAQAPEHPGLLLAIATIQRARREDAAVTALCRRAVAHDLAPPAAHKMLMNSLWRQGDRREAREVMRFARQRFPGHSAFDKAAQSRLSPKDPASAEPPVPPEGRG